MRKQPGVETKTAGFLTLLSVSPLEEDHVSLQALVNQSTCEMFKARNLMAAFSLLQQRDIPVVLCEQELTPGTWIDLLENITRLPNPPFLIVTSRLADERLWAKALNLGAWDVLAKPFDSSEVKRCLKSACQHWYDRVDTAASATRVMKAAS